MRSVPSRRRLIATAAALALWAAIAADPRVESQAVPASSAAPRIERGEARLRLANGTRATIPLQIQNNHPWTRGSINGSDSISILFDTGAYGDCIRDARARSIGLQLDRPHQARGAGGEVPSSRTERLTIGLPGLELRGDRLSTLPLEEIGAQTGRDLDVVVGHPLFAQSVVAIDYEHETMEVIDPKGWDYQGSGVVLPLTFELGHPYVTARVTLPGREPIEGRFVLDTGAATALTLGAEFNEKNHVLDAVGKTLQGASRGVGGQTINPVGRVERLEIGGIPLERPITTFRSPGPGFISAPGTIGNIGGGILRRFKVIFDYSRARMILEPNSRVSEPFEYDMSGLSLRTDGGDHRRFLVARVIEDSPAAELGLRPGDEISSVDGRPAFELGLPRIREMFRKDGGQHRLEVKRESEKLEVVLKPRRLI